MAGEEHEFGGQHTEIKLELVEKYLRAYMSRCVKDSIISGTLTPSPAREAELFASKPETATYSTRRHPPGLKLAAARPGLPSTYRRLSTG